MAYEIVQHRGAGKLAVEEKATGQVFVVFSLWRDHKPGRPFAEGELEKHIKGVKNYTSKSFMKWAQKHEIVCDLLADYSRDDIVLYQAQDMQRVFPRNKWFKGLPVGKEESSSESSSSSSAASPPRAPSPPKAPASPSSMASPLKKPLSKRVFMGEAIDSATCKKVCLEAIDEKMPDIESAVRRAIEEYFREKLS